MDYADHIAMMMDRLSDEEEEKPKKECAKEEDHDFDSTGQCTKCKAHRRAR